MRTGAIDAAPYRRGQRYEPVHGRKSEERHGHEPSHGQGYEPSREQSEPSREQSEPSRERSYGPPWELLDPVDAPRR